jgi:hypothetical protein
MADFSTPFANQAGRRVPTADEKINGFPCGPADQTLFNGLFNRLEAELGNLISYAGLVGSDADFAQVRKAIVALIDAATGGGDTSSYLLMSQASSRLPIYPQMLTEDFRINITAPATGIVRVPGGINFLHRGINQVTTAQTDFNTQANKTYHLRWNPSDGFALKDLSNAGYNPAAAAETVEAFDSTYDDMLLARIVTNSSNVATITNLANAHDLRATGQNNDPRGAFSGNGNPSAGFQDGVSPSAITNYTAVTLNWARMPQAYLSSINDMKPQGGSDNSEFNSGVKPLSRYQIGVWAQGDIDAWVGWVART